MWLTAKFVACQEHFLIFPWVTQKKFLEICCPKPQLFWIFSQPRFWPQIFDRSFFEGLLAKNWQKEHVGIEKDFANEPWWEIDKKNCNERSTVPEKARCFNGEMEFYQGIFFFPVSWCRLDGTESLIKWKEHNSWKHTTRRTNSAKL